MGASTVRLERGAARTTQAMALDRGRSSVEARTLLAIARAGTRGAGQAYPHSERIAAGFGRYAPEGLRAMVGGAAAAAGRALHADAFALGPRAGFVRPPDLRLAAHEAAHMVAQRHGEAPADGVGAPGDMGERLADAVADRVAGGASAEPLFDAALGPPEAATPSPALQMYNRIETYTAPKLDTPWKEITDQLGINATKFVTIMTKANPAFATMAKTLTNECRRAETIEAAIDGKRVGGVRKCDPMQSAYGNMGTFMEWITRTPQATNIPSNFEGGHLVSDEILGTRSYVQQNFAPQRRQINSPAYRKIEEIAARHLVDMGNSGDDEPIHTMKVTLDYVGSAIRIPIADMLNRLGLTVFDVTKHPATIDLTQRVPSRWRADIDSNHDDFGFGHETMVDPNAGHGAALGWRATEAEVDTMHLDTVKFVDTTAWAMDSLVHAVPGQSKTTRGTGGKGKRRRKHTFTAVQAVPMGQTASSGGGPVSAPPPIVAPPYVLKRVPSFGDLRSATLSGNGPAKKRRTDLARNLRVANPDWGHTQTDIAAALGRLEFAMLHHQQGGTPDLHNEQQKLIASGSDKSKKRKYAEISGSLYTQMTNNSGKSPF